MVMRKEEMMKHLSVSLAAIAAAIGLMIAGCTQAAAPPAPTQAPIAPTKAAELTKAAAAPVAPTVAPTMVPQPTAVPARALDFPTKGKSITLIVPLAAGGGTDLASRVMASGLEQELGTPVQVVNKPGASTVVGMTELAKAKPDGYTLGTSVFMTVIVSYLDPQLKATYARKDFVPVAHYMLERNILVVKSDSPYKTLKDLVDAGKAQPEKIPIAATGPLTNTHVAMLMLEQATGAKFAYVQFPGANEAVTAVLGGHVVGFVSSGSTVLSQWKNGTLRALGVSDEKENEYFPGVKTFRDQGYDVNAPFSVGVAAPAGTPGEIVEILNGAIKRAYDSADYQKKVRDMAMTPAFMDTKAFAAYWDTLEPKVKSTIAMVRGAPAK